MFVEFPAMGFAMEAEMVLSAKPTDIQRVIVIKVMRLSRLRPTDTTW